MGTPDTEQVIITLGIPGHGRFRTSAYRLDMVMRKYLPASVLELRNHLSQEASNNGMESNTYEDLQTVTECLMVLAELSGHGL